MDSETAGNRRDSSKQLTDILRQVVSAYRDEHRSDAELLSRFAATGDEDTFRALLSRHGRSVWGACLAILADPHDAEDAFQATFLALARQGASVDARNGLGPWLRSAARRAARNIRRGSGRLNRLRDRLAAVAPSTEHAPDESHMWVLAAEELERLPRRLREPLVMYHMEGRTLAQIAELLGCSTAAAHRRVGQAMELLRTRLSARGVALTAGILAAIPAGLVTSTASAATAFARGLSLPSARVSALADAIIAPRFPSWLIAVGATLLLAAGTAVALVAYPAPQKPEPPSFPLANSAGSSAAPADAPVGPELAPAPRPSSRVFRHDGAVTALAVSPDGRHVASAGADLLIRIWDSATGKQVARFDAPSEGVNALAFSPDGATLVAEDSEIGLTFWDLATGKSRWNIIGQATGVDALAFNSDGKRMVTIGRDGQLVSLDLTRSGENELDRKVWAEEKLAKFQSRLVRSARNADAEWQATTYAAAFTPDSCTIHIIDRRTPALSHLDVRSGRGVKGTLADWKEARVVLPITTVAIAANASWVAWGNADNRIGLVDLAVRKTPYMLRGHKALVEALAFTPDGRTLASIDKDGQLICSTLPSPDIKFESRKGDVRFRARVLTFSPDGARLYGAGANGEVRCWDAATLEPIKPVAGK